MKEQKEQYKTLFKTLDVVVAIFDFIRMFPHHVWFYVSCAYTLTVYRALIAIQIRINNWRNL